MSLKITSNSLFALSDGMDQKLYPDEPAGADIPSADFVLCRDDKGNPTAVYGDDLWDFNPYRLKANKITIMRFSAVFDDDNEQTRSLIVQLKWLMFCLIYHADNGHIGRLSAGTIMSYFGELRRLVQYCYSMKDKELIGVLSIDQLLSNPVYFSAFVNKYKNLVSFNKRISALLKHCSQIGEDTLGYKVCSKESVEFGTVDSDQHPLIPTKIYIELMNFWTDRFDQVSDHGSDIEAFLGKFEDELYGLTKHNQTSLGIGGKRFLRPDMDEAIGDHGLYGVFAGDFMVSKKRGLGKALGNIQYVCKNIIHLYTGMRDQEVQRLKFNCLSDEVVSQDVKSENDASVDAGRLVSIISTTTKFTGYKQEESWIACDDVVKAVNLLKSIASGICKSAGIGSPPGDLYLFCSPSLLGSRDFENTVTAFSARNTTVKPNIAITHNDLIELRASDPERDFNSDERFQLGARWPLSSHQYRRSLAFYAASSGFVSLPALKKQFKHLTRQMTQYYQNGFHNLKTMFGAWDDDKGEFVLPSSHVAYEFQTGITMDTSHQIIADVMGSENQLFGATGSYIEKQKQNVDDGKINIKELRSDTQKRVRGGELSYRETLLGGCTKVGSCDEFMLGDFTSCLSCEGSIIEKGKLEAMIDRSTQELSGYNEGSAEYMIVESEMKKLQEYHDKKIKRIEGLGG